MHVTVELPDELAKQIGKNPGELGRRLLEGFAIESYRSGSLTGFQIQQLLGLKDRFELDGFLKQAGVYRQYTADELDEDYQASRRASDQFSTRK